MFDVQPILVIFIINLFIQQMGNNNVCLGEIQNNASRQGSPDTKWKREDLKSGSCVQTLINKENTNQQRKHQFLQDSLMWILNNFLQNEHSASRWAQAISTLKYVDDIQTTINLLYNRSKFEELIARSGLLLGDELCLCSNFDCTFECFMQMLTNEKHLLCFNFVMICDCISFSPN
ncbi:unnamed protein product (macronuclear) [Paramecium tetraurelia]|uniref:Uncharacterized protein n=1 Tax=Paramecium tetraurelia TaxID=5888 RepID=A0CBR0_PARTE|nr:uncharacterized protein GSPATT00037010001 [Paramecium tetraurelia]CAK68227.1 unnamed protein product [Paramecium tetraurelia]|eukprot:XP_001435624.1 hypothetical protein (macronuclear) [Paramecium tetraurelia strain d4-2]